MSLPPIGQTLEWYSEEAVSLARSYSPTRRNPGLAETVKSEPIPKLPYIVIKDVHGRELDIESVYQRAIYEAKWKVAHDGKPASLRPEEWRLPHGILPARPDFTRGVGATGWGAKRKRKHKRGDTFPGSKSVEDLTETEYILPALRNSISYQSLDTLRDFTSVVVKSKHLQKTYLPFVEQAVLHLRCFSDTERRTRHHVVPEFCYGCRQYLKLCNDGKGCNGSSKRDKRQYNPLRDRPVRIGGGYSYFLKDPPPFQEPEKIPRKINHVPSHVFFTALHLPDIENEHMAVKVAPTGPCNTPNTEVLHQLATPPMADIKLPDIPEEKKQLYKENKIDMSTYLALERATRDRDAYVAFYKAPKAFALKARQKENTAAESPFSKNRVLNINKGEGFKPKKINKDTTEFIDFVKLDSAYKEPKQFELKKVEREPIKPWQPPPREEPHVTESLPKKPPTPLPEDQHPTPLPPTPDEDTPPPPPSPDEDTPPPPPTPNETIPEPSPSLTHSHKPEIDSPTPTPSEDSGVRSQSPAFEPSREPTPVTEPQPSPELLSQVLETLDPHKSTDSQSFMTGPAEQTPDASLPSPPNPSCTPPELISLSTPVQSVVQSPPIQPSHPSPSFIQASPKTLPETPTMLTPTEQDAKDGSASAISQLPEHQEKRSPVPLETISYASSPLVIEPVPDPSPPLVDSSGSLEDNISEIERETTPSLKELTPVPTPIQPKEPSPEPLTEATPAPPEEPTPAPIYDVVPSLPNVPTIPKITVKKKKKPVKKVVVFQPPPPPDMEDEYSAAPSPRQTPQSESPMLFTPSPAPSRELSFEFEIVRENFDSPEPSPSPSPVSTPRVWQAPSPLPQTPQPVRVPTPPLPEPLVEAPVPSKKRRPPPRSLPQKNKGKKKRQFSATAPVTKKDLKQIEDPLDYLAKYCIIHPDRLPVYERIFSNAIAQQDYKHDFLPVVVGADDNLTEDELKTLVEDGPGIIAQEVLDDHERRIKRQLDTIRRYPEYQNDPGTNVGDFEVAKITYILNKLYDRYDDISQRLDDIEIERQNLVLAVAKKKFPELRRLNWEPSSNKKTKKKTKMEKFLEQAHHDILFNDVQGFPHPTQSTDAPVGRLSKVTDADILSRLESDPKMMKAVNDEQPIRSLDVEAERCSERLKDINERMDILEDERKVAQLLSKDIDIADLNKFKPDEFRRKQSALFNKFNPDEDIELNFEEVEDALRRINGHLISPKELEYIYNILDLPGRKKINLKMFGCVAALSEKVAQVDPFIKKLINKFDYEALDIKMERSKELFCLLIEEDDSIPEDLATVRSLGVELSAGGLTSENVDYVKSKFDRNGRGMIEYLDFLTYVPLFIEIHGRIVSNPFDDSRDF